MEVKLKKYEKVDVLGSEGNDVEGNDINLALELSALLDRHYPGHQWMINVNSRGGVIDIKNMVISGYWGYRLTKPWNEPHDLLRSKVVMAGGEMLERAGLIRGKFKQDDEVTFVDGITRLQDQPEVQRNIKKYAELLNGPPTTADKH